MQRRRSERVKWALVVGLVAVGVWAISTAPAPPDDPFAGHDAEHCPTCRMTAPGMTGAERQRRIDEIRARAKGAAKP